MDTFCAAQGTCGRKLCSDGESRQIGESRRTDEESDSPKMSEAMASDVLPRGKKAADVFGRRGLKVIAVSVWSAGLTQFLERFLARYLFLRRKMQQALVITLKRCVVLSVLLMFPIRADEHAHLGPPRLFLLSVVLFLLYVVLLLFILVVVVVVDCCWLLLAVVGCCWCCCQNPKP